MGRTAVMHGSPSYLLFTFIGCWVKFIFVVKIKVGKAYPCGFQKRRVAVNVQLYIFCSRYVNIIFVKIII